MEGKLQFIGRLDTRVVGSQYYEAKIRPGDVLHFDRNPGNEFDENAIEARNEKGRVTGHLPRHHSIFLAPLLDEGWIFLKGTAGQAIKRNEIPVGLDVFVTDKGQVMLAPGIKDDDKDLVHAMIAAFFRDCDRYSSGTVRNMAGRFKGLTGENVLPQSILLSRLLHWKVKEIAAKEIDKFHEIIKSRLKNFKCGEFLSYSNLGLIPLFSDESDSGEYILLKEALSLGTFDVTEVSQSGQVPRLKVHNRGTRPVLILAGEELVGAKQNRVVNITVIIPALTQVIIPVSCVEQSRWDYKSDKFSAGRRAAAGLRSQLSRDVRASVRRGGEYDGDQGAVWEAVSYMHSCLGTQSPTKAMNDAYAGVEERLGKFTENLDCPKGAVGVAVFINGCITAIEAFDSPEVLEKLWSPLIESYAVDALMAEEIKRSEDKTAVDRTPEDNISADKTYTTHNEQYKAFLKKIENGLEPPVETPGSGFDVGIDGEDISGSASFDSGRLIHLTAMMERSGREKRRRHYEESEGIIIE